MAILRLTALTWLMRSEVKVWYVPSWWDMVRMVSNHYYDDQKRNPWDLYYCLNLTLRKQYLECSLQGGKKTHELKTTIIRSFWPYIQFICTNVHLFFKVTLERWHAYILKAFFLNFAILLLKFRLLWNDYFIDMIKYCIWLLWFYE